LTSGTAPLGSFVYDAAGNLTHRDLGGLLSGSVTDFLYDPNGQLRRATALASFKRFAVVPLLGGTLIPLPVQEQYYYDHTRRRFLTVSNTAPHPWYRFYLGDEFEVDVSSSDAFVRSDVYVAGLGEPIARLHACSCPDGVSCLFCGALTPSWLLHHDRRGDLLAATRLDGTLESHVIYGAFGEVLYKYQRETPDDYTAAADWNRLFNGKEADQATGLSYYGYRFYDPITFQWTTGDPLYRFAPEIGLAQPQNANLHAFTLNNPLRYVDRFGLLEESPPFNPMTCLVCETYVITATSLDTPAVQLADPEMPALYEKTYGYLSSPGFLEFHELYQRVGEVALERNLAVGKVRTMAPYIVGSQGLVWEAFKQSAIGALGGYVLGRVLGFAAEGLLPEAETAGAAGGGGGPYRVPPALPPPPPPPPPPEAVRALIRLLESGPTEAAKQWMFKRLLYPVPGPASP
jgi:RHS repeat-associated protein